MGTESKSLTIVNKLGLHARAAALLVKEASRFKSEITVWRGKKKANGKSIMGLLVLAAAFGSTIRIEASGADASQAIESLAALVGRGFDEN